jgi:hypothetical protein
MHPFLIQCRKEVEEKQAVHVFSEVQLAKVSPSCFCATKASFE